MVLAPVAVVVGKVLLEREMQTRRTIVSSRVRVRWFREGVHGVGRLKAPAVGNVDSSQEFGFVWAAI